MLSYPPTYQQLCFWGEFPQTIRTLAANKTTSMPGVSLLVYVRSHARVSSKTDEVHILPDCETSRVDSKPKTSRPPTSPFTIHCAATMQAGQQCLELLQGVCAARNGGSTLQISLQRHPLYPKIQLKRGQALLGLGLNKQVGLKCRAVWPWNVLKWSNMAN